MSLGTLKVAIKSKSSLKAEHFFSADGFQTLTALISHQAKASVHPHYFPGIANELNFLSSMSRSSLGRSPSGEKQPSIVLVKQWDDLEEQQNCLDSDVSCPVGCLCRSA